MLAGSRQTRPWWPGSPRRQSRTGTSNRHASWTARSTSPPARGPAAGRRSPPCSPGCWRGWARRRYNGRASRCGSWRPRTGSQPLDEAAHQQGREVRDQLDSQGPQQKHHHADDEHWATTDAIRQRPIDKLGEAIGNEVTGHHRLQLTGGHLKVPAIMGMEGT